MVYTMKKILIYIQTPIKEVYWVFIYLCIKKTQLKFVGFLF